MGKLIKRLKQSYNRIIATIIIIGLFSTLLSVYQEREVQAHHDGFLYDIKEGKWGNLEWKIDTEAETLTITGSGVMGNFYGPYGAWHDSMYYYCIKNVVISDGITCIGEDAFWNLPIENISIPDSVTSIKESAFYSCGYLESIDIPSSVTTIGKAAFEYAGLLSIEIPDEVNEIGSFCFWNCKNLGDVNWPTKVDTIESYTFSNCEKLNITIPKSVKQIKKAAFNGTSNMSFNYLGTIDDWCTIEFEDKSSNPLTNSKQLIINNQVIKSATISSQIKEINDYTFYNCQSLTEVTLTNSLENIGKSSFYSCSNLTKITIPGSVKIIDESAFYNCEKLTSITIGEGVEEIKKSAFYFQDYEITAKMSINIPDSVKKIESEALENDNILNITINNPECEIEYGAIRVDRDKGSVYGWWHSTAQSYAEEYDYNFVAIGYNNTQYSKAKSDDKKMKIVTNPKISVPEKVPCIGGEKINLDFSYVDVKFVRKGNSYKLAIGAKIDENTSDSDWKDFKKLVESKGLKKWKDKCEPLLGHAFGTASVGAEIKPETSCYGYAEGIITSEGIQTIKGGVIIEIKTKASKEWQVMVVYVPVVIKASLEVGIKTDLGLKMDFSKQEISFDGVLDVTIPKIKASGGIGLAYVADVSVYGSVEHKMSFPCSSEKNSEKKPSGSVTGEMGVSAKLLFASYEKSLWQGTWNYTDGTVTSNSLLKKGNLVLEQISDKDEWERDDTQPTNWNGIMSDSYSNNLNKNELQSDVYSSSNPQLIKLSDGTLLMTYIAVVNNRDDINHYAAVYSIYQNDKKKWTDPQIINDDGTADFNVKAIASEQKVYFIYNDFREKIANDFIQNNLNNKEEAELCGIEVAELDLSNYKLKTYQIEGNHYFYNPTIYISGEGTDKVVNVGYCENVNDDILKLSGNNFIHLGYIDDKWNEINAINIKKPILHMEVGEINGCDMPLVTYNVLDDKNSMVVTDFNGEEKFSYVSSLTYDIMFKFINIRNKKSLVWKGFEPARYSDDDDEYSLYYLNDLNYKYQETLLSDCEDCIDYSIINIDETTDYLLCSIPGEGDKSTIKAYKVDWGTAYKDKYSMLIEETGNLNSISATFCDNNDLVVLYNNTYNVEDEGFKTQTDLYMSRIKNNYDVSIVDVEFDENEFLPGQQTEIKVQAKNFGINAYKDDVDIDVLYNGKSVVSGSNYFWYLSAGEKSTRTVKLDLPDNISKKGIYTVNISINGKIIDSKKIKIGKPDLELVANQGETNVKVTVSNISGFSTNGVLYAYDENGNELFKEDLGLINPEEVLVKEYNVDDLDGDSITFTVESSDEEQFENNNSCGIYKGQDLLKTLVGVEVNKTKLEYKENETVSISDLHVYAVYDDGTKKEVYNYYTNIRELDMSCSGVEELLVTYGEVGIKGVVSIPIVVGDIKKPTDNISNSSDTSSNTDSNNNAKNNSNNSVKNNSSAIKKIKTTSIKKITAKKKCLVVKWKKSKGITGYKIQYSLKKNFKKAKTKTVKKASTTSLAIKKLKSKKKYYVRIRTYKKVNGKIYQSKWSKAKSKKTK